MAHPSSTEKAKVLEQIVAMLHEGPDVTVEQRVKLPTLYKPRIRREIDVLVTGHVAGHRVQVAIECKSIKNPVGTEQIGDFARKLEQVGLAPSQGLFVTTSRFTEDALDRAQSLNMKTLIFPDLTEDGLNLTVSAAIQSIVFLLPEVARMNLLDDMTGPIGEIGEAFLLYDPNGEPAGTIPDFVWDAWRTGEIERAIGQHVVAFQFPDGWYNLIGGQKRYLQALSTTVQVSGLALTLRGESRRHTLVDAADGSLERLRTEAAWSSPQGRYELRTLRTPADLEDYMRSQPRLPVISQVPVPRIRFWNMMFWPPSERVAKIIKERLEAFEHGSSSDPRPFAFAELEGTDLSVVWEPIAEEYLPRSREAA